MKIDLFLKKYPIKHFAFFVSLMLIVFYFEKNITDVIIKNLLTEPDFSNILIDTILFGFILLLSFYLGHKIVIKKYVPSLYQKSLIVGLLIMILYFYSKSPWDYLDDNLLGVNYMLYILTPLMTSTFFYTLISLWKISDYYFSFYKKEQTNNILISDNPISSKNEDKLEYEDLVNSLREILLNDIHEKSFSIGLVGPWGNGKSSVVELLKEEIANKTEKRDDVLIIHFLPYLNHKEDDIINEFFSSFSEKLSEFNGKLSNDVLNYSQKLTNLYKNNDIIGFFDKHVKRIDDISAKSLYDSINDRLEEINKKIIVFVDDLDRLNSSEILQILKLIRNTADFKNTIFVVAMDKAYVISRVKSQDDVLDTRFIDKFFQLEAYLPEIDSTVLQQYFIERIKLTRLVNFSRFSSEIENALQDRANLFNGYIKNFRDVKRFINQLVFDYPFYGEEISLKDFMNFTYLKLKFPRIIKVLNEERDKVLITSNNGDYFELEKKAPEGDIINNQLPTIFYGLRNFKVDITKYKHHKKQKLNILNSDGSLSSEEYNLLLKTLACLFGDENANLGSDSIKYMHNFSALMQQKPVKNKLLNREFEELFLVEPNKVVVVIDVLLQSNKVNQLINRFNYFNSNDHDKLKRAILVMSVLWSNRTQYQIVESELLKLLAIFADTLFKETDNAEADAHNNQVDKDWIKGNVFDGEILSVYDQLILLGNLWDSKNENNLWSFSEEEIRAFAKTKFDEYLVALDDVNWELNDFSFYRVYHLVKIIFENREEFYSLIIEFWRTHSIKLFCVQSTDLDSFSLKAFKIGDTIAEIFGSKTNYYTFVNEHNDSNLPEIIEYLDFLSLCLIVRFSHPIIYEFKHFNLMKVKIEMNKEARPTTYDEYAGFSQVFYETSERPLILALNKNTYIREKYQFIIFDKGEKMYIRLLESVNDPKHEIEQLNIDIRNKVIVSLNWINPSDNSDPNDPYSYDYADNEGKYIKIISVQRNIKN